MVSFNPFSRWRSSGPAHSAAASASPAQADMPSARVRLTRGLSLGLLAGLALANAEVLMIALLVHHLWDMWANPFTPRIVSLYAQDVLMVTGLVGALSLLPGRFYHGHPHRLLLTILLLLLPLPYLLKSAMPLVVMGAVGAGLGATAGVVELLGWRKPLGWGAMLLMLGAPVPLLLQLPRTHVQEAKPMSSTLSADAPNILWVVYDTTRADHLSLYGYERQTSPNLDALGAEGSVFENAFSAAPWTAPSHASMLTGLFPHQHGCTFEQTILPKEVPYLPALLSDAGYETALFAGNPWLDAHSGMTRGFLQHFPAWRSTFMSWSTLAGQLRVLLSGHDTDKGASDANAAFETWLTQWMSQGMTPGMTPGMTQGMTQGMTPGMTPNPNPTQLQAQSPGADVTSGPTHASRRPFFALVNYTEAHIPYYNIPRADRRAFVTDSVPDAALESISMRIAPIQMNAHLPVDLSDDEHTHLEALYDGGIHYEDRRFGELIGLLRQKQLLDNTLVIVVADHGELMGEHNVFGHDSSLYQPLLHVPLVMRWPGHIPAGKRIQTPVQLTDLFGTVLHSVGLKAPARPDVPQHTLLDALQGIETDHRAIFAELDPPSRNARARTHLQEMGFEPSTYRFASVMVDQMRLLKGPATREQLFDLKQDPGETRDVSQAHPEVLQALRQRLATFEQQRGQTNVSEVPTSLDPATRAQLEALGYVH